MCWDYPRPEVEAGVRLERAIVIAAEAHEGQVCKYTPEPYILHCLRVMLMLDTTEARIVGVLHDVVEDTDWILTRLHDAGCSTRVLDAINALTRGTGESYDAYLGRVERYPLAVDVKLADLADNTAPGRTENLPAATLDRYLAAIVRLRKGKR